MSIVYDPATKNARMQIVVNNIGATGFLKIGTAGMATILAIIPLANPAGVVVGSTIQFTVPQTDTSADANGTAAAAVVNNGTIDVVSGLTVGISGTDILVPSTTFSVGQTITLTAASITHG